LAVHYVAGLTDQELSGKVSRLRVAIGEQLRASPRVITLGVRPQMADYTRNERELLRAADVVFYPTARFVDLFATLGKETFPSVNCYRLRGDRLKQTALMHLLNVPHPRTRVYYGHRQKREIINSFVFPFIAKTPFGSSKSGQVFLVDGQEKLDLYNQHFNPAYIQEYVDADIELRVVVLNYHTLCGYWRKAPSGDFRADPALSEAWRMANLPTEVMTLARRIAWDAGLSDVAVEMLYDGSRCWVLELKFQYGKEIWPQAGEDRLKLIMEMIERGEL
jgi:ribosomal protein S6--L-glutamate ligase